MSQVTIPKPKKPKKVAASQSSLLDYFPRTNAIQEPESTIPSRFTIPRTLIQTHYRLSAQDVAGLSFREESYMARMADGTWAPATKYLYTERDVERVAWKNYGGPKGLKAHIEHLEQLHNKRFEQKPGEGKAFKKPLFLRFEESWVWVKVAAHLAQRQDFDDLDYRGVAEQALPRTVRNTMPLHKGLHYPARPTGPPPQPSPSFLALSKVLTKATLPGQAAHSRDVVTARWPRSYLKRLFAALVDVLREDGAEGWVHARWAVYDKFAECFGSISYDLETQAWVDIARPWLCGQGKNTFVAGPIGDEYNSLLPHTDIYGLVHTDWCARKNCKSL